MKGDLSHSYSCWSQQEETLLSNLTMASDRGSEATALKVNPLLSLIADRGRGIDSNDDAAAGRRCLPRWLSPGGWTNGWACLACDACEGKGWLTDGLWLDWMNEAGRVVDCLELFWDADAENASWGTRTPLPRTSMRCRSASGSGLYIWKKKMHHRINFLQFSIQLPCFHFQASLWPRQRGSFFFLSHFLTPVKNTSLSRKNIGGSVIGIKPTPSKDTSLNFTTTPLF